MEKVLLQRKKTSFEVTKVTEGFRKLNSSSQQVTGNRLHPPIAIRKDSNICCNRCDAWGTNWTNYPDPANLPNSQSTETQKMNSGLSRTKKTRPTIIFCYFFAECSESKTSIAGCCDPEHRWSTSFDAKLARWDSNPRRWRRSSGPVHSELR